MTTKERFADIIQDMANQYMDEMLIKFPIIAEERIDEDETGDVLGGLIEGFTKWLLCEKLPEEW